MSSAAERATLTRQQARLSYQRSQSVRTNVRRLVERSWRCCELSVQALARRPQISGGLRWQVGLPARGALHHLGCVPGPDPSTTDVHR